MQGYLLASVFLPAAVGVGGLQAEAAGVVLKLEGGQGSPDSRSGLPGRPPCGIGPFEFGQWASGAAKDLSFPGLIFARVKQPNFEAKATTVVHFNNVYVCRSVLNCLCVSSLFIIPIPVKQ